MRAWGSVDFHLANSGYKFQYKSQINTQRGAEQELSGLKERIVKLQGRLSEDPWRICRTVCACAIGVYMFVALREKKHFSYVF